jgi:uncharacterized protein (TIGR02246 family)
LQSPDRTRNLFRALGSSFRSDQIVLCCLRPTMKNLGLFFRQSGTGAVPNFPIAQRTRGIIMSERELLLRIDRLEAIEQIRRLKARYFAYCDNNYDPDGIASLFTEDAVWEGGSFGHYKGREEIREHFQRVSREIVFAAHLGMNAIIDVNGDTASAQWRMIMPSVVVEKGAKEARWFHGFAQSDQLLYASPRFLGRNGSPVAAPNRCRARIFRKFPICFLVDNMFPI